MSVQDFMLRHFVQVSIAEVETWIGPDAPWDEEVRPDALGCPGNQVDQCPSQKDVVYLHVDGQDTDFCPSGKELSRWVAQLESEMKGKDRTVSELRDTVDELADTVSKDRGVPRSANLN